MHAAHLRFAPALTLAMSFLAPAAGCARPSAGGVPPAEAKGTPVARVDVVRPDRQTVRRTVAQPGQLIAFETTSIHAKISGYVERWNVNIGTRVKKGDVLAELSVPETEAELKQKKAAVEQSEARRVQAKAAVEVADANLTGAEAHRSEVQAGIKRAEAELARWQSEASRVTQLVKVRAVTNSLDDETQSKLRSAESTRDEVLAQVKTADAALVQCRAARDQARADVAFAEAAIDVAREDARRVEALLAYTRIAAPFDGIVTRRTIETGQLTKPGADTPALFVIARADVATIVVDVPESYATEIDPGDRALVKLQAARGKTVEAKVSRTAWSLDPDTRTIRVEIDLPNPGGQLRPGLYAYATIVAEEHAGVLTVPASAVIVDQEQHYCVVVDGGKAVRRRVEIGLSDATRTEIVAGLSGGEQVVKANAGSLTDGQSVDAALAAAPAAKP